MRITNLRDLRKFKERNKIKEALIEDVISIAEAKFKDEYKKFMIQVRLKPLNDWTYK